jgi:hypothetical protein
MTDRMLRNLVASVRQRLMNLSREQREEFQIVLTRYGLERLLYRLTQSAHAGQFILKGAVLFQLWTGHMHRATRDLDLLGEGAPSADRLREIFRDVCTVPVPEDGLEYRTETVQAEQIKEEDEYQGIRLRIEARLGNVRIPLQIDIGFGDAITPGPVPVIFPTLLDFPAPSLQAYPRETVVAEKFQAMVQLGMANSRMKDFFDIWTLARTFEFPGPILCSAIRATFVRRRTPLPAETPLALTAEFGTDRTKGTQWRAFLRRARLVDPQPPLDQVVVLLESFLMPPTIALSTDETWNRTWRPTGWRN